jgi:hypothetical protein
LPSQRNFLILKSISFIALGTSLGYATVALDPILVALCGLASVNDQLQSLEISDYYQL